MRIEPNRHYCYVMGVLLKSFLEDEAAVTNLMKALKVPGKSAHLNRASLKEKMSYVDAQVAHLATLESSEWYGVAPAEIVAAHLWRSLNGRDRKLLFSAVKAEAELLRPVVNYFESKGYSSFAEVPMGRNRVDLVAIHAGGLLSKPRVVAVELKNSCAQLKRALDQMTTFGEHATQVYLACTPAMAAEYLDGHARAHNVKRWDETVLNRKLKAFGFGLLLVRPNFNDHVELIEPAFRPVPAKNLLDVISTVERMTPL